MNRTGDIHRPVKGGLKLGADRKTVVAVCLVAVMAIMWMRMLFGGDPEQAGAQEVLASEGANKRGAVDVEFVELPRVEGRHDVLTRNFFTVSKRLGGGADVSVSGEQGGQSLARRIASRIQLDAIEGGVNSCAFINDRLLRAGEKFFVDDGGRVYECEVKGIEGGTVWVQCEDILITLKLSEESDISK